MDPSSPEGAARPNLRRVPPGRRQAPNPNGESGGTHKLCHGHPLGMGLSPGSGLQVLAVRSIAAWLGSPCASLPRPGSDGPVTLEWSPGLGLHPSSPCRLKLSCEPAALLSWRQTTLKQEGAGRIPEARPQIFQPRRPAGRE